MPQSVLPGGNTYCGFPLSLFSCGFGRQRQEVHSRSAITFTVCLLFAAREGEAGTVAQPEACLLDTGEWEEGWGERAAVLQPGFFWGGMFKMALAINHPCPQNTPISWQMQNFSTSHLDKSV